MTAYLAYHAWAQGGLNKNLGLTAEDLQSTLLGEISAFAAGGIQTDDITLMILARDLPG